MAQLDPNSVFSSLMKAFLLLLFMAGSPLAAQSGGASIPVLGAKVTRMRFFEGGETLPGLPERQYAARFDSAVTRSIYVEIGLSYPPLREPAALKIECGYTAPGGMPAGSALIDVQADVGWELSVHAGGSGRATPGGWAAGAYQVACHFGSKVIASGSFEIIRPAPVVAPAAPALRPAVKPGVKAATKPTPRVEEKPAGTLGSAPFGGLKGRVSAVRFFESGGDVPDRRDRVIATSFDALTIRFINIELELEYPKAARRAVFEVACRYEGPDSTARTPVVKGEVDAGWIGSYHTAGWGARNRGMWPEGTYRVSCVEEGRVVVASEFKVVRATAAVAALGASLTHLRFYQSLAERLPVETRQYGTRFDARSARWIKAEFGLVYPAVVAPVNFSVECLYTFPDGSVRPATATRQAPAGWTGSVHVQGLGWERPGHWPPGSYHVSCRSDGRDFAAGNFEVFDGALTPAIAAGGSLRFSGRRSNAAGGSPYASAFEVGTYDTLYMEAAVPLRASGDSTTFRCGITDPAGVTSSFSIEGEAKDRNLFVRGFLGVTDSPRMRGAYRVECHVGTKAVIVDRFAIEGKPEVVPIDGRFLATALFEGAESVPDDEAVPDVAFSAARVRSFWLVALLDHPTESGAGGFGYSCKIIGAKNTVFSDSGPAMLPIEAGDRAVILRQRMVLAPKQKWVAGKYSLTCASGAIVLLRTGFDLTR
jgi:hypothetical protein